jgi:hypothetical protein
LAELTGFQDTLAFHFGKSLKSLKFEINHIETSIGLSHLLSPTDTGYGLLGNNLRSDIASRADFLTILVIAFDPLFPADGEDDYPFLDNFHLNYMWALLDNIVNSFTVTGLYNVSANGHKPECGHCQSVKSGWQLLEVTEVEIDGRWTRSWGFLQQNAFDLIETTDWEAWDKEDSMSSAENEETGLEREGSTP